MFLVEQVIENGYSKLLVFNRNANGTKTIDKISNFRPYFFLKEDTQIEDPNIIKIEKGFKSIDNVNVKKVYTKSDRDIRILREGRDTWTSDFLFANRYIVDTYKDQPEIDLKVFNFDIETDSDNKFPDIETANQSIISISTKSGDKNVTFAWREDLKTEELNNGSVRIFDNEVEMLKSFLNHIRSEDPDILFGFCIKNFDLPYLYNRLNRLNLDYRKLSHQSINTVFKNRNNEVVIKGRVVLDLFELLNHPFIKENEWSDISLDGFSKEILNEQKIKHTETFHEMWRNNIGKLIKYNIRDVELVDKIDKKKKIIQFFDIVRRITNCQFDDFRPIRVANKIFYGTSKVLDCYMFSNFPDIVFPNRRKRQDSDKKFEGALVLEPKPGIYENAICLDLKSLYPNIMKSANISFETIDPNGEINVNGIKFTKKQGFIPKLLFKIGEKRDVYKKLMKEGKTKEVVELNDQRQKAIKVIGNAFYGYFGLLTSRLYKKELASSVTYIGRELIKHTIKLLEKLEYQVLLSDTDSTYVIGKETKLMELLKEATSVSKILNESYDDFAKQFNIDKHYFIMEFEKLMKKVLFLSKKSGKGEGAKKRYVYKLLWSEKKFDPNRLYMSGVDAVRSNESVVSKNLQTTVLDMIIDGKGEKEVKSFIKDIETKIRDKTYTPEEIGFPMMIGRELKDYASKGPIIVGSIYSNQHLNTNFGKGSKPKFLKIKKVIGYPQTPYLAFNDEVPEEFEIDYEDVVRKTIKNKVETAFKVVGWNWEDLCVGNQSIKRWF